MYIIYRMSIRIRDYLSIRLHRNAYIYTYTDIVMTLEIVFYITSVRAQYTRNTILFLFYSIKKSYKRTYLIKYDLYRS